MVRCECNLEKKVGDDELASSTKSSRHGRQRLRPRGMHEISWKRKVVDVTQLEEESTV